MYRRTATYAHLIQAGDTVNTLSGYRTVKRAVLSPRGIVRLYFTDFTRSVHRTYDRIVTIQ